ncbi:MAG: type II toxin-antitoxin system Phd/YefM family antitoxin [Candidatus Dormibacteria bacterium]
MAAVTIRDLRNHGGDVVDRVLAGERVTITRAGKPVAELRPLASEGALTEVVLKRWKHVPVSDFAALRRDLDGIIDPSL